MHFLVTGGCGFIGSNFIRKFLTYYPKINIVNLDALTYAGNPDNLKEFNNSPQYLFVNGDVCDRAKIDEILSAFNFDVIFHFAAESHVDRSITGPSVFLQTNIIGTHTMLEAARVAWKNKDLTLKRFVHISTDEVYGALSLGHWDKALFTETTPIAPNSPYAASKASSDLIARAYYKTYGLPVTITRCSNNYGPYQYPEKFIPVTIINALQDKPIPVYGDGMYVRDWLHVDDHCNALMYALTNGRAGEVYNVGGNCEMHNIDVVRLILSKLGKPESLITHVEDRLGHDRRYAIDASKITKELDWRPQIDFQTGINETIDWYIKNESWWRSLIKTE
jgi:dTDP-glucose 4,6-dehydratase